MTRADNMILDKLTNSVCNMLELTTLNIEPLKFAVSRHNVAESYSLLPQKIGSETVYLVQNKNSGAFPQSAINHSIKSVPDLKRLNRALASS